MQNTNIIPKTFRHNTIEIQNLETETIDGKRFYVTPTGIKYPSITTVVSLMNAKSIQKWRERVGEEEANRVSLAASTRGTKVHSLCEDYINNKPIEEVQKDFLSIKPVIDQYVDDVYAQEASLYSDFLQTAGRVDLIAKWDGKPAIIDFKTSKKKKTKEYITHYFMQASGYAVMFEELTGIPIPNIVILISVDNNPPQIFVEKRNKYIGLFIQLREKYKELYGV